MLTHASRSSCENSGTTGVSGYPRGAEARRGVGGAAEDEGV